MDLLGGYSSNSDSENSNSDDESQSDQNQIVSPIPQPQTKPESKEGPSSTHITKQKKKLLSLNAVLPSEIFERLTRSIHDDDSSSDEDDEEESIRNKGTINRKNIRKGNGELQTASKNHKSGSLAQDDMGISSLLHDLKSNVASASSKKKPISIVDQRDTEQNDEKEVMGFAFTKVTTTTVKRAKNQKNDNADVIQIHGVEQKKKSHPGTKLNSESISLNTSTIAKPSPKPSSAMLPPPPPPIPTASSSVSSTSRMNFTLPRPSTKSTISAAPSISSSSSLSAPIALYSGTHHYRPSPQMAQSQSQQQLPPQQPSKKTKRQIQQALRSGNFSDLSDDVITNIHNPSANNSFNVPSNSQTSSSFPSTKSVASSEIYDPKQGKMVANYAHGSGSNLNDDGKKMAGKMRSKHQIHHLVQNARVLEANRRLHGHSSGGSNRVDAKRKYGW